MCGNLGAICPSVRLLMNLRLLFMLCRSKKRVLIALRAAHKKPAHIRSLMPICKLNKDIEVVARLVIRATL